jgi:methylated-DNA-[protein]-cysteine S-methyltransferase
MRDTQIGPVSIEDSHGCITRLSLHAHPDTPHASAPETSLITEAFRQLDQYLDGRLRQFSLPLKPLGTPFMQRVWQALLMVPYGTTASYKDIASAIGQPGAARAVGMANNRNPIAIIIPCHRIIGANGKLVGYASGLDMKKRLLELEGSCHYLPGGALPLQTSPQGA